MTTRLTRAALAGARMSGPSLVPGGAAPVALIVDDDDVLRAVLRGHLEGAGFSVEEASDGPGAIAKFARLEIDIVLLDIVMPGMDGFDACSALRALPGGRQCPIVMMTGLDDRESIERAYEVGATDFISKPINSFVLTHRLQHILRANHYLVHFDGLTGLPRRELFLEHLKLAIASGRRSQRYVAILFLDLDDFDRFNEELGQRVGDQILSQVADRLGELRSTDYFARNSEEWQESDATDRPVARFGGDEFMIVLPDIQREKDIALVAGRINESLSRPFLLGGEEIRVTASIGISAYPLDGSDPQLLLERAAIAMSHAKAGGRGGYQFYSDSLNERTRTRRAIESALRVALERAELELHFQPRIDIQGDRIASVEALVRMPSSTAGPVSPADFIPVAEETGLIVPLGDWVFRNACETFAKLQRLESAPSRIAINLSAAQFGQDGFPSLMLKTLERIGLDPQCVELELTEGVLFEDTEASIATLSELKDLGFRIAVDDFGTGYSSLSYLKRLPVDVLKIDRAFVRGLPDDPGDCAIVEAVIDLAHKLSLEVVAEGVEEQAQLEFLRAHGCDEAQGFLFGGALTREALTLWLNEWDEESDETLLRIVRESLRAGR